MTRDGVLSVRVGFGPNGKRGEFKLLINGAAVWVYASWDQVDASGSSCLVRVSTGDVISCKILNGIDGYDVTYFPLKS